MKKICYVSANGFIGGAEKVLINLAKMHKERGEEAYFILFKDGILHDELKNLNVKVFVLKNKFKLSCPLSLLKAIFEIRTILKKNDFTIIHSTMAYSHLVMGLSSMFMNTQNIWFQHGPVGGILDFLASFFKVDIILFNSDFLMKKHMNSFGFNKGKYAPKVIALPVKLEEPKYSEVLVLENELKLNNKFVIGSFGRISRGKNYELLIKAFSQLEMKDARLMIVGSPTSEADEEYLAELEDLCLKLDVRDEVLFISHQTNVSVYYKLLHLYVHSGVLDEGFGLTVAEAMYLGVPVISSPYGALEEFVRNNETAYAFYSREQSAVTNLKDLIVKSRQSDFEIKRMAKIAQENIKLKYSFSNFQIDVTDVYQFLKSID